MSFIIARLPSEIFSCPCLSKRSPPVSAVCRSKMDKLSKSDPFVVVQWKTDSDENWREVGESTRHTRT